MVDRISTLPDPVLCHILSFLPTEIAVATSVLSKRWKHLWRSVPALHLSNRDAMRRISWFLDLSLDYRDRNTKLLKASARFTEFVYSVMFSRDAAQPIPTFFLDIESDFYDFSNAVNKWVNVVSQRGVEHVHLKMTSSYNMPNLPIAILKCTTLVVLKLKSFSAEGFSSVRLPSLKTLHLEDIQFHRDRYLMMLLDGCPILEDLLLLQIVFDFEHSLTDGEFQSLSLTKMKRADIKDIYVYRFHFPLKALYNVESLRIDIDNQVYRTNEIATFHNLTHLELIFIKYKWHLVVEVLNHCPKLQDLFLYEEVKVERADDEDNWVDPEFVPECLSFQLRTCKLSKFVGLQGVFLFARYILKNARVLQTMEICGKEQLKKIKGKLSSCPRSSAKCKLLME